MTNYIAGAALLISIAAAWAAFSSAKSGKRSAKAAEASEKHAKISAQASVDSADAARLSAEADGKVARIELDRDHESYRPGTAGWRFVWEPSDLHKGQMNLIFEYTPERGYRAAGKPAFGPGNHGSMSMDSVFTDGDKQRIVFDSAWPGRVELKVKMLELQLWPALEGDPGEAWTCRCGRNTDPSGEAHWVWNVPVVAPPMPPTGNTYSA